jgi:4'-phosphopantetheinyl transferase
LHDDERARLARKRQVADRQRELTSRAALRLLLGAYLDRPAAEISFAVERGGKPVLATVSAGPRVEFNVSHAGDWVLLAFTPNRRLGVDVEAWSELASDDIVHGFFAPAEQATWTQLAPAEKQAAFFSAWTRKEAFLKALGIGLARPLDSFAVHFAPGDTAAGLLWCADDPLAPQRWTIVGCNPAPSYSGAIAVEAPEIRIVRHTADFARDRR